jgi:hypothetical protein
MSLDVQSYSLGHLGIVAGIFDSLKIGEAIDEAMPKQGSKNLPHSVIVKRAAAHPAAELAGHARRRRQVNRIQANSFVYNPLFPQACPASQCNL